jgi:hypothetical protein
VALSPLAVWAAAHVDLGPLETGPPRELVPPLPYETAVKDPAFAVLVGLLESRQYGVLRRSTLAGEIQRRGMPSRLPYQKVALVSRQATGAGTARLTLEFTEPLSTPIPYSILGYHPGRMVATTVCRFREWDLGDVTFGAKGSAPSVALGGVHLFALEEGDMKADIAGWFDVLMAGALDDVGMTGFAFLSYNGRRTGVAFGYNDDRRGYVGAFDFGKDELLFPPPRELKVAGARLRSCSERLMKPAGGAEGTVGCAATIR